MSYKTYSERVMDWMRACFSNEIIYDRTERQKRFLEESLELVQALGLRVEEAHDMVDYVFNRKPGNKYQECGGVMVCLAALCHVESLSFEVCADHELSRVWTKIDEIRTKHATKPDYVKGG